MATPKQNIFDADSCPGTRPSIRNVHRGRSKGVPKAANGTDRGQNGPQTYILMRRQVPSVKKTAILNNKRAHAQPLFPKLCDKEYGCYSEEYFHEMLAFERKRSERSGRPFLVMTLDLSRIVEPRSRRDSIKAALDALSLLTRATDIKGWARNNEVLGVLFTEMNSLETDFLQAKITENLHTVLLPEQYGVIQVNFYRFPDDGKSDRTGGASATFDFYPDLPKQERDRKIDFKLKRMIDVVGSIVAIVLFSPFFILIPIAIKLTSKGPVLFRQERIGQYRVKFMFWKFRSMYVNNNDEVHRKYVESLIAGNVQSGTGGNGSKGKVYKITKDSRVTPVGKFLRKTSLDELPQFFNVLKGDMSLVGPRPPLPYEVEKYDVWHRCRIMEIKPGITGLWQVGGRSSTTFNEMVRLDLQYARNWTLWLDIKLLLKTPTAVIAGKGAY